MKDIKKIITETLVAGGKDAVRATVNQLLGEDVAAGQTVAVIDDVVSGYTGIKGKVRKISDSNPGFAEVELPNGTSVMMQSSLLVPV